MQGGCSLCAQESHAAEKARVFCFLLARPHTLDYTMGGREAHII